MTETVSVHVWQGGQFDTYDDILSEEPAVHDVPVAETDYGKHWELSDDEQVILADSIDHHGTYAFDVPNEERSAIVNVHTCDSYHSPYDWGPPVERGLTFHEEDDHPPFQCELWGRVMLWVDREKKP